MRCDLILGLIRSYSAFLILALVLVFSPAADLAASPAPPALLTNLSQLRHSSQQADQVIHPFRIVAEVLDVDSDNSVLAVRDASGAEFIHARFNSKEIEPGAIVCLEATEWAVRSRGAGLALVPGLIAENDGIHPVTTVAGKGFFRAGKNPISATWFNREGEFGLGVEYEGPGTQRQPLPSSMLSRAMIDTGTCTTNFAQGLDYRCYEGAWDVLPDFERFQSIQSGVVTNFDIAVRSRAEDVGMVFNGFITLPGDGVFTFYLSSDDGSRLYVGGEGGEVRVVGRKEVVQEAKKRAFGLEEARHGTWITLEGTVTRRGTWGKGGEIDLRTGNEEIRVEVFDSSNTEPGFLENGKVQVSGIYQDVINKHGVPVRGRLLALSWNSMRRVAEQPPTKPAEGPATITTAAELKALSTEVARQGLPVTIRGVVTAYFSKYSGAVIQDATRGVFVELQLLPETNPLHRGEYCQVEGVTGPGFFAPDVVAHRITHLGPGQMPTPLRTTRDGLVNGSLDTEYAEIDGIVTEVRDRSVVLLMHGGKIKLDLTDFQPAALMGYKGALVRIRGCVFANFDPETHKLGKGSPSISGAAIEVLSPAPQDPSGAPLKSLGELLFYDSQPATFRLLRVGGQIIYERPGEYFLSDGTNGLRVTTEKAYDVSVGDIVEAVGFLDLGGPGIELKEAMITRTGKGPLRAPVKLTSDQLLQASHADMLVQLEATLMNQWREHSDHVLELQSGFRAFKARVSNRQGSVSLPPSGSRLELTGVYSPQGNRAEDGTVSGFELLLSSPKAIRVLATPSWWTLKRVLVLAGILSALLCVVLLWNKELRRQVQERTRKWETEIRNRQRAELQQTAEAERSRIARDLHDELGTGLTEVSLLASAGLGRFQDGEKIRSRFNTIAEKARALVSGLDVIIWAIDPKRNSLQSFTDYVADYANELFSDSAIACRPRIKIECGTIVLTEASRHSLFLAVKEALNNVIRHASATEVELRISQVGDSLHIVITDNGVGFNGAADHHGNGLENFQQRLKAMRGECRVESQQGIGTAVTFIVPLGPSSERTGKAEGELAQ